ncbi:MAG: hypothetical protein H0W50_00475 [Parachlamydiaceae bacterium]|nr:hypothetical protein [Parachlamydiaceae bacterium]
MYLELTNNNKIFVNSTGKRILTETGDMSKFTCSFKDLPLDALARIFSSLRIEPLTALCMTSKHFEKVTNFAPVWKFLCKESGILTLDDQSRSSFVSALRECNRLALFASSRLFTCNTVINPNYDLAIRNLNSILLQKLVAGSEDSEEQQMKFKENVVGQIKFVEAVKALKNVKTIDDQSTKLAKFNSAVNLFLEASQNKNIPIRINLEADYYAALNCLLGNSNILSNFDAGSKLQSIFQNSEDYQKIKSDAKYYFCLFTFENKFNIITKEETGKLLESLVDNPFVGYKSKFLFLKMNFLKIISSLTGDEMMILALSFLDSKDIHFRTNSIFMIGTLALTRVSILVSDDYIAELLQSIFDSDSPLISATYKNESKCLLSFMCCEKRSQLISDADNAKWILEYYKNTNNPINLRKNCCLALVKMIIENRTKLLSYNQAAQIIIQDVLQNASLNAENKIIFESIYLISKMVIDNLTHPKIDAAVIFTLLFFKDSNNPLINGHAKLFLAELTSKNRTKISYASAFNYAAEACNNQSLTEEMRNNAASLMEKFRDLI